MEGPHEQTSVEQKLAAEARALEQRLAARDPEFRRLQVIKHALAELAAVRNELPVTADGDTEEGVRQAASIYEAAQFLIEEAGEPLAVGDIFVRLPKYGRIPGGGRPRWLLSNLLSADKKRFESVLWKGRKRWWLKDRALPSE
jgi:hypothetical protein